ncbi:MAG: CheY-like chemotaxis protein [Lentisphaeria bacterium]|jgi:CheY-like chemotaxis protein
MGNPMLIRILVVDEAAFVRDTLKRSLRRFLDKVEVYDAINGNRAIAALKANKIDLILSDWDLPELSGAELLRWVRSEEKYEKTPFIVVSSQGDRNMVVRAIESGASDFLPKPFSPDDVQKKVVKQLARIGYKAKQKAATGGSGFGSIDVLTSGGGAPQKAAVQKPREIKSAGGFGSPAKAKPASKPKSNSFGGRAQLRFSQCTCICEISELSLTAMNGLMPRPEIMPTIFDTATAEMVSAKGQPLGILNVYVHSLQSVDPRQDAGTLKITVRFAGNSPEQFEALSKAIAIGS